MIKSARKKDTRDIAVWLDHTAAWIYEPGLAPKARTISSGIESRVRIPGETADGTRLGNFRSTNNEAHKHNRRQNQLRAFYKDIASALIVYDEITIAGLGTSGQELYNFISGQSGFKDKKLYLHKGASEMPRNLPQ